MKEVTDEKIKKVAISPDMTSAQRQERKDRRAKEARKAQKKSQESEAFRDSSQEAAEEY